MNDKDHKGEVQLKDISVDTLLDIARYDPETQQKILDIKDNLDLSTDKAILSIGSDIAKDISAISKRVLQSISVKNLPELETLIPQLDEAFNAVDTSVVLKRKGVTGILSKWFNQKQGEAFVTKFESAEKVVNSVQSSLEVIEMELRKDIEIEDALGCKNLEYIQDLQNYIVALKIKLDEIKFNLEQKRTTVRSKVNPEFMDVQEIEDVEDRVESIEQQIYWLEQQRLLAIQTLPVLRNLKKNNKSLIRQINLAINNSIPAWEQGVAIAFHIQRQQGAIAVERAVHDMTNQVVLNNSRLLRENSLEVTKAVKSGMIDIEVFQEANENLIEATKQIQELSKTSMLERKSTIDEYSTLVSQLLATEKNSNLLSSKN